MSKLFDNMLAKFFAVIVIILFIVGFREMILTDRNVSNAFGELMGILPFAEPIVNAACTILGYQYELCADRPNPVGLYGVSAAYCYRYFNAYFSSYPIGVGRLSARRIYEPPGLSAERADYHSDFHSASGGGCLLVFFRNVHFLYKHLRLRAFRDFGNPGCIDRGCVFLVSSACLALKWSLLSLPVLSAWWFMSPSWEGFKGKLLLLSSPWLSG